MSLGFERPRQMKGGVMRKEALSNRLALTPEQEAQLRALDGAPDTTDINEAPAENWQDAYRFHRVRKEPISIRVDADVLDWLRRKHDRYQVEINRILREKMEADAG
jgi:uncharacterized protein (DUF4415 family)